MAVRIAYANLLQTAGAVIVPSSEQTSMPRAALLRPSSSDRLRFKSGYTVAAVENSRIDFDRGGVKVANIAAGSYATPALYAAAVQAAMTAADGTPTWVVDYGVGAADTFRIRTTSGHSFTLLFGTGVNKVDSAAIDLGFAETDTASAVSQLAGAVSYQSRHWINVDLGLGATNTATVAVVAGHNLSAAGVVTFQMDNASMIGNGLGNTVASGLTLSQTLPGTTTRVAFISSTSERRQRLIISDVQNSVGFNELGVWWFGLAATPTVGPSIQFSQLKEPLSSIAYADGGAHHQILRGRRRAWSLIWQLENRASLAVADRALFDAIDALGIGASFFLCLDDADPTAIMYGFNRVGLSEKFVQGAVWEITLDFAESL